MKLRTVFSLMLIFMVGCSLLTVERQTIKIQMATAPTAKEVRAWQRSQKWKKVGKGWSNKNTLEPVLIKGTPVDRAKYPAVVRIRSDSGSGCTAAVVGPQAILTAAHCAETGERVSFQTVDGKSFTAVMTHYEQWPGTDLDLNLGKVSTTMSVTPLSIRTDAFEQPGMLVELTGYGCTQPGGTGGNDGILRAGTARVTGAQAFDLVTVGAPAALCYGDSGGPVLYGNRLIGVNSKGNIVDKNFTTRTTHTQAKAWLERTASALGLLVCGVNSQCGGGETPPPKKEFFFEDANVKINGVIK